MIHILITIIAPIIVIAGLGALLDRTKAIETRAISRVVIYLANPALAFYGIANSSIKSSELGGLFLFSILSVGTITIFAWLVSVGLKMDRLTRSAFILSIALINMGNYGLPLNEFAFGQPGLERAIIIAVLNSLNANTLGIFLASSGKASIPQALVNVFKVPLPHAVILGLIVNLGHLSVPDFVMRVTGLLSEAAVPLMLIMLGIQISRVSLRGGRWKIIAGASSLRLLGGAVVGFLFSVLLGLEGVTHKVAVVEAAMPTAVVSSVLATEFDNDSKLVSSIILLSTLLSLITLPIILYFLMK
jgi:predicted permease